MYFHFSFEYSISASNLEKLKELKKLDLSGNKIKDLGVVTTIVNKLPSIQVRCILTNNVKMVYIDDNPCWTLNSINDAQLRVKVSCN